MEALADKVHKLGKHIPQHCYISHSHPYTSSSGYWYCAMATYYRYSVSHATRVGMVVWNVAMLWNMLSLFVYSVSRCMRLHPSNYPYIWYSEISFWNSFLAIYNYRRKLIYSWLSLINIQNIMKYVCNEMHPTFSTGWHIISRLHVHDLLQRYMFF